MEAGNPGAPPRFWNTYIYLIIFRVYVLQIPTEDFAD